MLNGIVRPGPGGASRTGVGYGMGSVPEDERMVDALALAAEEGRGHAAKCSGEALAAWNPEISEWGNPPDARSGTGSDPGGHRGN